VAKLKSSLRQFYGGHHVLVNCYGISVSQMTHIVPLIVNDFDACIAIHFRRLLACYFPFSLRLFHMKCSDRFNNMLKIAKEESEAEIKNDKRTIYYILQNLYKQEQEQFNI
jgi:hypothetical protein